MSESQQVSEAEVLEQVAKLELFYKARGENNSKSFTQLYDEAEALLIKRKNKQVSSVANTSLPSSSSLSTLTLPPLSPHSIIDDDDDDDSQAEHMKLAMKHTDAMLSSSSSQSFSSSTQPTHMNIIKNRGNITFNQSNSVICSSIHFLSA
jgi:hypothetical protein